MEIFITKEKNPVKFIFSLLTAEEKKYLLKALKFLNVTFEKNFKDLTETLVSIDNPEPDILKLPALIDKYSVAIKRINIKKENMDEIKNTFNEFPEVLQKILFALPEYVKQNGHNEIVEQTKKIISHNLDFLNKRFQMKIEIPKIKKNIIKKHSQRNSTTKKYKEYAENYKQLA